MRATTKKKLGESALFSSRRVWLQSCSFSASYSPCNPKQRSARYDYPLKAPKFLTPTLSERNPLPLNHVTASKIKVKKVLIAGASVGGLTLALSLQRLGITTHIVEAQKNWTPQFGDLAILPLSAMKIFQNLGVDGEIEDGGVPLHRSIISNPQGETLGSADLTQISRENEFFGGLKTVAIHKPMLLKTLQQNFSKHILEAKPKVLLNFRTGLLSFTENPKTGQLRCVFDTNLASADYDAVIIADGSESKLRKDNFPISDINITNQNIAQWSFYSVNHQEEDSYSSTKIEMWHPQSRLFSVPASRAKESWIMGALRSDMPVNMLKPGNRSPKEFPTEFAVQFPGFGMPQIIKDGLESNDTSVWVKYPYQVKVANWIHSNGKVGLLGDAAHAMLTYPEYEVASEVEDAWVLSECIVQKGNIVDALKLYEQLRKPRVEELQKFAWEQTEKNLAVDGKWKTRFKKLGFGTPSLPYVKIGEREALLASKFMEKSAETK